MTDRLNLCLNCLEPDAHGVEVGPEKGSQRDPYREHVQLCETCKLALLGGDFGALSIRYAKERKVSR